MSRGVRGMIPYASFFCHIGIYLMNYVCTTEFQCYISLPVSDELTHAIIAMWVEAVIFLVAGLYLDQVLPRQFGVRRHPLFLWHRFRDTWLKKPSKHSTGDSDTDSLLPRYQIINEVRA
jgi:hypothetical protein